MTKYHNRICTLEYCLFERRQKSPWLVFYFKYLYEYTNILPNDDKLYSECLLCKEDTVRLLLTLSKNDGIKTCNVNIQKLQFQNFYLLIGNFFADKIP